jgi:hypothetical protein
MQDKARAIMKEILHLAGETRTEFLADLSAEESGRLIDMLERIHATARTLAPLPAPIPQSALGKSSKRAAGARNRSSS